MSRVLCLVVCAGFVLLGLYVVVSGDGDGGGVKPGHAPVSTLAVDAAMLIAADGGLDARDARDSAILDSHIVDSPARSSSRDASAPVEPPSLMATFKKLPRDKESERRFLPVVQRVFGKQSFRHECHGNICRVSAPIEAESPNWVDRIQDDATMYNHFLLLAPQVGDPEVYVELEGAPEAGANAVLNQVFQRIGADDGIIDCKERFAATPESVMFKLKVESGTLVVMRSGTSPTPAAKCLETALWSLAAKIPVPDEATTVQDVPITIAVP